MKMGIEIDAKSLADFNAALNDYQRATKKDSVDVVNRAAKNVAARAIQFTPKAKLGRFPLNADPVKQPKGRRRSKSPKSFWYAKEARTGRKGTPTTEANRAYKRARASSGYIKAGFIEAFKDFGGKPRLRTYPRGDARRGWGKKATSRKVIAEIMNYSTGADKIAGPPLQAAMRFVAFDMKNYAARKMGQTAKKYSAKQIRELVGA